MNVKFCSAWTRFSKPDSNEFNNAESKENNCFMEDIALIQSRLEEKLSESQIVSVELDTAQKEKKDMLQDNTRLNHRIAYLEEYMRDLQFGLK